jgi:carbonic anhydrase
MKQAQTPTPSYTCACCVGDAPRLSRRSWLTRAATLASVGAMMPVAGHAASGNYEAMIVSCIDPRFQRIVADYARNNKLEGKYSHIAIAGASIAGVAEPLKDWHKAVWDNIGTSIQLHGIKKVVVLNHRDCGAAKIAYGEAAVANRDVEKRTHQAALQAFAQQLKTRHPAMQVELGLLNLDGSVEFVLA